MSRAETADSAESPESTESTDVEKPSLDTPDEFEPASRQATFGDDGDLEVTTPEGGIETSLDQWGFDISHRDPTTRIDKAEGSLTADTRPTEADGSPEAGEQEPLFRRMPDNQVTLGGEETDTFQFRYDEGDGQDGAAGGGR